MGCMLMANRSAAIVKEFAKRARQDTNNKHKSRCDDMLKRINHLNLLRNSNDKQSNKLNKTRFAILESPDGKTFPI